MNAHQLDADGVILNTIVVESLDAFPGLVDAAIGGKIGDRIVDWTVIPAPLPVFDLVGARSALIRQIDADVDQIYAEVVGNRSDEYNDALAAATAYKAAGYPTALPSDVPPSVASWAAAKGWSAQEAADDILAAAANLGVLRDMIRAQRLARKEAARLSPAKTSLDAVAAQWAGALAAIRAAAGLS